jgi:hypothetical protein
MLRRPGALRRHGLSNDLRSLAGISRFCRCVLGLAQIPPEWIRNEQDRPKRTRYSNQHREEKRASSNLQSLRRPRLLCVVTDNPCFRGFLWITLAVMPGELVFDTIEAELEHRGVEL